jgi:hypothetical protein
MHRRRLLGCAASLPLLLAAPHAGAAAADDAGEDIDFLLALFERIHPGLYRQAGKAAIDQAAASLKAQWTGTTSLPSRYLALSRFLSVIRCGHTYANFVNQNPALFREIYREDRCFPLPFRWLGASMIATAPAGGVPSGARITAIDGVPAAAILQALTLHVRIDGRNEGMRRALLSPGGTDTIETFDVFYQLLFGCPEHFVVRFVAPDGRAGTERIAAVSAAARRRALAGNAAGEPADGSSRWPLEDKGEGSFLLRMASWSVYKNDWDWRGYLDSVFARLESERATRLVLDIRGNEGGLDCGDEIVARLIDRPLAVDFWERLTRYRRLPDEFRPHVSTWDKQFFDWEDQVTPVRDGFYRFVQSKQSLIQPASRRFKGKVVVLTDANNHSATLRFAMIVKQHRLARLAGETTGGSQRGINGGAFFFVKLPRSRIEVDLPLIAYMPKQPLPADGVRPDLASPLQPAALARGRDAVLEEVLRRL